MCLTVNCRAKVIFFYGLRAQNSENFLSGGVNRVILQS